MRGANHAAICVDQVIGRIGKESRAFAGGGLLPTGDVYITERH
jgi:hypothetical protein